MIILYNILQLLFLTILGPILFLLCLVVPKYRVKIIRQLGLGSFLPPRKTESTKRIWIHALSVGEVTSALPLVRELRKVYPEEEICFSANTTSGRQTAVELLTEYVDFFIVSPLDLYPVVKRFCNRIQPDLYIHVETDFWPNQLFVLQQQKKPAILVNGRISKSSFKQYQKFNFFFRPLFASFHTLSMQTEADQNNMIKLGVAPEKITTLGNLKYDVKTSPQSRSLHSTLTSFQRNNALLLVAGSTHEGEEEILFKSLVQLKKQNPDCQMILAPRDISRAAPIAELAKKLHLSSCLKTTGIHDKTDVLILDTLGELYGAYQKSDIAFVGGSLLNFGGHNPIEPASCGVPVLFGPYMDDFSEVSTELLQADGGISVKNVTDLTTILHRLVLSPQLRQQYGEKAAQFVASQRGVVANHIALITNLL